MRLMISGKSYDGRMGDSQDFVGFHAGNDPCPNKWSYETPPGKRRGAFAPWQRQSHLFSVPCQSCTVTVQAKMELAGPNLDPHSPTATEAPTHLGHVRKLIGAHLAYYSRNTWCRGSQSKVHSGLQEPVKLQTDTKTFTLMFLGDWPSGGSQWDEEP